MIHCYIEEQNYFDLQQPAFKEIIKWIEKLPIASMIKKKLRSELKTELPNFS